MSTKFRTPCEFTEKLLSELDLARMTGLNATQWIQRVDSTGTAYSWDDSLKLVQAVNKLCEAAKLWTGGLVSEVTTWNSFKQELRRRIPSTCDVNKPADFKVKLCTYRRIFETQFNIPVTGDAGDANVEHKLKYDKAFELQHNDRKRAESDKMVVYLTDRCSFITLVYIRSPAIKIMPTFLPGQKTLQAVDAQK
ncbi:hypothetical protein CBL_08517 [Carabus blaptoides fortunei]